MDSDKKYKPVKPPQDRREYSRKYYLKNRERIIEQSKKYYYENKEMYQRYKKMYYLNNKEKIKANRKEYVEKNREKVNEYKRRYRSRRKQIEEARRLPDETTALLVFNEPETSDI